ncbi:2'-5' RNA ligase family protein [Streptacidiphilus sp. MAP5-52]|uniref:2'-5' RNA ligase family protein n=1 Tax=Streptacidiphilus sp. MAP5-52 TaxID=3156267 RepID=UPI0035194C77
MHPFVPTYRGQQWPDKMSVLHIYFRPPADTPGLADLVRACTDAAQGYPATPLAQGEMHLTIEMVADAPSADIPAEQRTALIDALRRRLAPISPINTELGPPTCGKAGIYLDVWPDQELEVLREAVRAAVLEARGPAALVHDGGRLHASINYSWGEQDSDPLNSALRRIPGRRVPVLVDRVELLDVTFTAHPQPGGLTDWQLTSTPVADIALGGAQ